MAGWASFFTARAPASNAARGFSSAYSIGSIHQSASSTSISRS